MTITDDEMHRLLPTTREYTVVILGPARSAVGRMRTPSSGSTADATSSSAGTAAGRGLPGRRRQRGGWGRDLQHRGRRD